MLVEACAYGPVTVLTVMPPRFTGAAARDIRQDALAGVTEEQRIYLLDLKNVTLIDSSGLGALVGLMKHIGRDGRLELCGLAPRVRKALRLTRLDGVFTVHADLAAGLDAHYAPRAQAG